MSEEEEQQRNLLASLSSQPRRNNRQELLNELKTRFGMITLDKENRVDVDESTLEFLIENLKKEEAKVSAEKDNTITRTDRSNQMILSPNYYPFTNYTSSVIYDMTITWIILLAINPWTAFFWAPFAYFLS